MLKITPILNLRYISLTLIRTEIQYRRYMTKSSTLGTKIHIRQVRDAGHTGTSFMGSARVLSIRFIPKKVLQNSVHRSIGIIGIFYEKIAKEVIIWD
jgi:hypothetical protein